MKIVATSPLPIDLSSVFGAGFQIEQAMRPMPRPALLDAVREADGLLCLLHDRIDEELLSGAPRLKAIGNYAVGLDNVDLAATRRRGVAVCNTPDVLTEATADLTFALLLAVARRVVEGDTIIRNHEWGGWQPELLYGADVHGKTILIIGPGRIGQAVARRAHGFDMKVITGGRGESLDPLLHDADFVVICAPLLPETRGLIDARKLALMKRSAYLVNAARGPIVDEAALAAAIEAGTIAGAGLDVFADEPHVHPALLASPKVVLTPHIGSATRETRTRMAELAATGIREVLSGRRPPNQVSP